MSRYNSGALEPGDVECLQAMSGASFHEPVELPSGRVISGEEATALCAALVPESIIREPEPGDERLRCADCRQGLRIGDAQILVHQDGTPICNTPERTAWLSARHLLKVDSFNDRERRPIGVAVALLVFSLLGALCWGGAWAVVQVLERMQ